MKKILFAGLIAGLFVACHKDFDNTTNTPLPGSIPTVNVESSLNGRVINAQGDVLVGAKVQVAGQTYTTNAQGLFFVYDRQLDKNGTYLQVSFPGYFPAARFAYPHLGTSMYVEITLAPKSLLDFTTSSAAEVVVNGGASLTIPAESLVTAGGQAYSGSYKVAARWLDPTDPKTFSRMPGDLRALNADGQAKILKTFGMIGVELSSPAGEALQLAPGKKAIIRLPVPATLQSTAPATIALWHFEEASGYWLEDGNATLEGNQYVGEVSHFSFWNCDVPGDYVVLNGSLTANGGLFLPNVKVALTSAQYGTGYGYTDVQGQFSGIVPANEPLLLKVLNACNEVVYESTIGPFATNTTLSNIEVAISSQLLIIAGDLVDCNNAPLSTGVVYVFNNDSSLLAMFATDANGHFQGSYFNCYNLSVIRMVAYDVVNPLQSSLIITNAGGPILPLQVCTALDQYAILKLNGTNHNYYLSPVIHSSGNDGTLYAFRSDSTQIALGFSDYSATNNEATISYLNGSYYGNNALNDFGCEYCPGCLCTASNTGPVVFTSYPQNIGEYAQGTASGMVWDSYAGSLVPYILNFRLKKTQ